MSSEDRQVQLKSVDGWAVLPSALQSADKTPRFEIRFPVNRVDDLGAIALVQGETSGGYERATASVFEKVLRSGDLFIDVGAHWGYFTLLAVTHPAGEGNIRSIAFEPDPENGYILYNNLLHNHVSHRALLVCTACGDTMDLAPLTTNSSMGHSVRSVGLQEVKSLPPKFVVVTPLDSALACFPHAAQGRVILKIDAEGYDAKVIAGAEKLIDSGRVALITWERHKIYSSGAPRESMLAMVQSLQRRGFTLLRPRAYEDEGAMIPFDPDDNEYNGNVFACSGEVVEALR